MEQLQKYENAAQFKFLWTDEKALHMDDIKKNWHLYLHPFWNVIRKLKKNATWLKDHGRSTKKTTINCVIPICSFEQQHISMDTTILKVKFKHCGIPVNKDDLEDVVWSKAFQF